MSIIKVDYGTISGGGNELDLTNMTKSSSATSIPATSGKKYLVIQQHGGGGGTISSGGTVDSEYNNALTAGYIWVAIITATASTVNFTGGQTTFYMQLD